MLTAVNKQNLILSPYWGNRTIAESAEARNLKHQYYIAFNQFTDAITTQTPAQKFEVLTTTWKEDMKYSSSIHSLMINPSYLGIIAMGKEVLPFIFEELKKKPDHWFIALKILTGVDPVPETDRGNISAMTSAWLQWGLQNKYVAGL